MAAGFQDILELQGVWLPTSAVITIVAGPYYVGAVQVYISGPGAVQVYLPAALKK